MHIKIYSYKFGNFANKSYLIKSQSDWLNYMDTSATLLNSSNLPQNFNTGDGVTAVLEAFKINDDLIESANYCVIFDNFGSVISSWFIVNYQYLQQNLYQLVLKRDVITNNINKITASRGLVKRGFLNPLERTPLQFIQENLTTTKIKTKELLLQDNFKGVQWLTTFWSADKFQNATTGIEVEIQDNPPTPNITYATRNDWDMVQYINQSIDYERIITGKLQYLYHRQLDNSTTAGNLYALEYDVNGLGSVSKTFGGTDTTGTIYRNVKDDIEMFNNIKNMYNPIKDVVIDEIFTSNGFSPLNVPAKNKLSSLVGQYIHFTDEGKTYQIEEVFSYREIENVTLDVYENLPTLEIERQKDWQAIYTNNPTNSIAFTLQPSDTNGLRTAQATNWLIKVDSAFSRKTTMQLVEVTVPSYTVEINTAQPKITNEPFKILAIPFSNTVKVVIDDIDYSISEIGAMSLASALQSEYGGSAGGLYDIQVLPYAPSGELEVMSVNGFINYDLYNPLRAFNFSLGDDRVVLFSITQNSRSFQINIPKVTVQDYKRDKMFKSCRLTSGSYKSVYDFSVAMNDGLETLNVNMTAKPNDTFIHVVPQFNWLYGNNTKDLRGLVVAEDLSITKVTSEWENYKLQNKNFQNTFNLQQEAEISSMTINHRYKDKYRNMEAANNFAGLTTNLGVSAIAGKFGLAQGITGASSSLLGIGNTIVKNALEKSQDKEILAHNQDVARRMFDMNLENIQNIPSNLTKVSGFNILSKYYPLIEFYDTLESEKEIVNNFLMFNAYSINALFPLSKFLFTNTSYDYVEFLPYVTDVYSNITLNLELTRVLGEGVYLCYDDKLIGGTN